MHFIFASEVVFNLPDCTQKKSCSYDKPVKKISKKTPLGGGGQALKMRENPKSARCAQTKEIPELE